MKTKLLCAITISCLLGCNASHPAKEPVFNSLEMRKDLTAISDIHEKLEVGMTREEVEALLGNPDYSPTDGKYYYASSEKIYSTNQERELPIGLIIDYRSSNGDITGSLKNYWIGELKDYQNVITSTH